MARKPWQKCPDGPKRLSGRAGVERRRRWLRDNCLCVHCLQVGRVTAATIVDHRRPLAHGGVDDESNLQSLCKDHHDRKSIEEKGGRVKPIVGVDGRPEGWE